MRPVVIRAVSDAESTIAEKYTMVQMTVARDVPNPIH